jgi:hypothetical protein
LSNFEEVEEDVCYIGGEEDWMIVEVFFCGVWKKIEIVIESAGDSVCFVAKLCLAAL